MNGKMKAAVIVALVVGIVASAVYVAPTLAYMNGTTDQTRDRDMDRDQLRDRDCLCDCDRDLNQTRTRLHLQECVQNQTNLGPVNCQYQNQYQYRHQSTLSP